VEVCVCEKIVVLLDRLAGRSVIFHCNF